MGNDLINDINNKITYLETSIRTLAENGKNYAKAYTEYRIALAQELAKLKAEGYAITLAGDIARGKPEIARLKYKEIANEAIYKANLESINAIKLTIKIIENQIDREWTKNE